MASIGQDLTDVPFPTLVASMASSIAEAQFAVDMISLKIAQLMAGNKWNEAKKTFEADESARVKFGESNELSLLELGFTPTFYQFVDTIIEVKMSVSMSTSTEASNTTSTTATATAFSGGIGWMSIRGNVNVHSASVNAAYASKYQYSAEGSSLLRTKLVPVPPPAILEERIRAMIAASPPAASPPAAR